MKLKVTTTALVFVFAAAVGASLTASAAFAEPSMTCRKVVAAEATGEGRNTAKGSRARCNSDEFLTGGTCYPEVRPEEDGSCQTSAMGIIQTVVDFPGTTRSAFFTCMQTGGTDCPVQERTRAMAICCK
jgi:hypothetical protein